MKEALTWQPALTLPLFDHYYGASKYYFREAAELWAKDRKPILPASEDVWKNTIIPALREEVINFTPAILSDRFHLLSTHIASAASVICWTEGKEEDAQRAKVETVKDVWEKRYGIAKDNVLDIIGQEKDKQIGDAIAHAEGKPIVVMEDKITNMMKVMRRAIKLKHPHETIKIGIASENELDTMSDEEFTKFLDNWRKVIKENQSRFRQFRFLYIPPEKRIGATGVAEMSLKRNERVRQWLELSNNSLVKSKSGRRYRRFFHIDDSPRLESIFTKNTIVIADVDGPLVSQLHVVADCEKRLQNKFLQMMEQVYEEKFGMPIMASARFIFDQRIDRIFEHAAGPESLIRKIITKSSHSLPFMTDPKGLHNDLYTRLSAGNLDKRQREYFDFMPLQFQQTLRAMGIDFNMIDTNFLYSCDPKFPPDWRLYKFERSANKDANKNEKLIIAHLVDYQNKSMYIYHLAAEEFAKLADDPERLIRRSNTNRDEVSPASLRPPFPTYEPTQRILERKLRDLPRKATLYLRSDN